MGLVGGIIGGPPAGFVSDRYGRKVSIVISGLLFGAGYTIIAFAKVKSLNPQAFKSFLMIGRLVTGIGSGWSFVSTPVSWYIISHFNFVQYLWYPTLVYSMMWTFFFVNCSLHVYTCICTQFVSTNASKIACQRGYKVYTQLAVNMNSVLPWFHAIR